MIKSVIFYILSKLVKLSIIETHTLNPNWITKGGNVLDLGANHGAFSQYLNKNYNSKCYLVEANLTLVNELKQTPAFTVLHAAATGKSGPVTFNVAEVDDASTLNHVSTSAIKASVTVDGFNYASILKQFNIQSVDVLKIDIEGAEIDFIENMTDAELLEIKQLTIEFHDWHKYYPSDLTERTINRLIALGFTNMSMVHNTLDVLLTNNKLCEFALLEKLRLNLLTKPFLRLFWTVQNFLILNNVLYK
jgi:FkbM family methyltransferase